MTAGTTPTLVLTAHPDRRRLVAALCLTQTVGYGALMMCFPVLLVPMCDDLGISRVAATGAVSISILVGALVAVPIGRLLDFYGGRALMAGGSVVGALGVLGWSQVRSVAQLYAVFVLVGIALATSTYEAAFAVLVAVTDQDRRDGALLGLTMVTGLATNLFYPLTDWLEALAGWRGALVVLAALLAVVAIPVHAWLVPGRKVHVGLAGTREGVPPGKALRDPRFWLLGVAFVVQSGAVSAVMVQLVPYLRDSGIPPRAAAAIPLVIGVATLGVRLGLTSLSRRFGMISVTACAFLLQAVGAGLLPFVAGSARPAALAVAAFGVGMGVAVIARGSILADQFGAARFASVFALMTIPIALARAGSPLGAAWLGGGRFLGWAGVGCAVSAACLWLLRVAARRAEEGQTFGQARDIRARIVRSSSATVAPP